MFFGPWCTVFLVLLAAMPAPANVPDYPFRPVLAGSVKVQDHFWAPRVETNRRVTIPHLLRQLEAQGSLGGFALLAGQTTQKYHGYLWGDSDVYKTLEGIAYTLRDHPDSALEDRLEQIIRTIAGAQAADGYLMPHLQITEPRYRHFSQETSRTCESYSMGHMIESAVAHYEVTGRKNYLEVALKCADLLARIHAGGTEAQLAGHFEIELALVKLYRATGQRKYLELARSYVQNARSQTSHWAGGKPFLADETARGHAVAATYLCCGATDVAELTGDAPLSRLLDGKWSDMVSKKLYLTGGIGLPVGEALGQDYDLPNATAYCETCAAIANIFWNYRMFRAHGEAKYLDVLERTLYNGFLAGVGMSGDRFFYPNPLACPAGKRYQRTAWFGCPCCPTNVVRFLPQIGGYIYAVRDGEVFVNLFIASQGKIEAAGHTLRLRQQTEYPWDGQVKISIETQQPAEFTLRVRIPGWCQGRPVPTDLYHYVAPSPQEPRLTVNGEPLPLNVADGFAGIRRTWRTGDTIELDLPMAIHRVVAHEAVRADAARVALERGPLVYCLEGVDHGGQIRDIVLPDDARLAAEHRKELLGGVTVLCGEAQVVKESEGRVIREPLRVMAVPYYAWGHRGAGEMAVWIARSALAPENLCCEYRAAPPGIDAATCHFAVPLLAAETKEPIEKKYDATDQYNIHQAEGWRVLVNAKFEHGRPELCDQVLTLLSLHLHEVVRQVPSEAIGKLKRIPIWVEENRGERCGMAYHPNAGWLAAHGVNPDKAQGIEIINASNYLQWSLEQPAVLIHELAHAYHDRFLPGGFKNREILTTYQHAKNARLYEHVLGPRFKKERAYAMKDQMEYFAETSEAMFGTNDFYPFVKSELWEHDPQMYDLLRKLWGVTSARLRPPAAPTE